MKSAIKSDSRSLPIREYVDVNVYEKPMIFEITQRDRCNSLLQNVFYFCCSN